MSAKGGGQFLHLACQGGGTPPAPVSYAAEYHERRLEGSFHHGHMKYFSRGAKNDEISISRSKLRKQYFLVTNAIRKCQISKTRRILGSPFLPPTPMIPCKSAEKIVTKYLKF